MQDRFGRVAYRLFGDLARWTLSDRPSFSQTLQGAGIRERADAYVARWYAWGGLVVAAWGVLFLLGLGLHVGGVVEASLPVLVLFCTVLLVALGGVYAWAFYGPEVTRFMRGEAIDDTLPFAVNYLASMASADVTPERLFENLARQEVYGEVAQEAALITRDVEVLGRDVVTALSLASSRSPSSRFAEFLDGAVSAITAGGALSTYLSSKADQYMESRRQEQASFLDSLSILAESYVTVAVAGPMFVIVMLTVMVLFGTSGRLPLELGYVLMVVLVPLVNMGFVVAVETISPEV